MLRPMAKKNVNKFGGLVFWLLFYHIKQQVKPIKMNKLQNLIIDITVPLAWMLILSAAAFAVVLLPQIIFVAVCDCQPTF
jgi:hypothetical protein